MDEVWMKMDEKWRPLTLKRRGLNIWTMDTFVEWD